jgi:glycosyltransferase involved in cell wall biosynthesis
MTSIALCIPAYQAACYLPRLLRSAQVQVVSFDEIWVYDDASSDNTSEIAMEFGAQVIRGDNNIGCSAGKNVLLHQVSSEWIHFHDADDELLPEFTLLAHKWISRGDACPDVLLFNYEYRDNETFHLIAKSDFDPFQLECDPLRYAILNQINPFCGLYRRCRLLEVGGYDTDKQILYNEDVAFHCKLAKAGLSFSAEKTVALINYRLANSMSNSNTLKCLQAHVEVMRRLACELSSLYPLEIKQRLWAACTGLAVFGRWREVDTALALASSLTGETPKNQSASFALLCLLVGPRLAFRMREIIIRLFKPSLRPNI